MTNIIQQQAKIDALTARVEALDKMLKKILPEQNPLHAEISCDYCTAFQNIDLDEEDRHDPDCPWLLVYGPDSNSTPALDLAKHDEAVRRDALEQAWRPIETAPKDNHSRLVWVPENRCAFCVTWSERDSRWEIFGGWRTFLDGITHWMPLPPPPSTETLTQEKK